MVPAEQNEPFRFFERFGNVLVRCGLGHRVNVHACRFEIWRLDKPQVTYRTQAKSTVGSASMRPLPCLPRVLFNVDSEIAPQTIYCFLCIGPTTGLCSLLSRRNPGPSP